MIKNILNNKVPDRFVYAPNYWQWFAHHKNHNILPEEIKHCETQLDLIKYLGLDIFSRNCYCEQSEYWFGGICEEYFDEVLIIKKKEKKEKDTFTHIPYKMQSGELSEDLRYVFKESTVVQDKFLIKDYNSEIERFEEFVNKRNWKFNQHKYDIESAKAGEDGVLVVGDFYSPLKMLHLTLGPANAVYFLMEHADVAARLMAIHEERQLKAIEQCVKGGVKAIMAMDNLDSMFHPPMYVEQYSASYYEQASAICEKYGAKFFIHACGNQKENLKIISNLGVHGLEGVAYPPLGNVTLKEAFKLTHDGFIITGGISAFEFENFTTKQEIFSYIKNLFNELTPYKNRFVLSASCNTPINAPWNKIKHFRDAWLEYKEV